GARDHLADRRCQRRALRRQLRDRPVGAMGERGRGVRVARAAPAVAQGDRCHGLDREAGGNNMRRMRTFPAIPQSVHAARRFAIDTLSASPASTLGAVELMVSELATNCIRHERTSFHITIVGSSQEIRVEVTDSGSGTPTMRSPGPDEPSGRGLQIVDMPPGTGGVEPETPSGKTVWFTMPAAAAMQPAAEEVGARH